ncbi:Na(+)/H(+) antiporter subunit A [Fundidesulfovibrio magnetotacticus]|uniref:Na(+)/H(+) antiporter subunit A n=1 Tax=Fundidesulfovibrio magnetotacticus TaxID=2730080 RepID=A0A6V8LSG8_9BACT|nr:Na(+)/H(+) antiporter subunit D [Fundidesulfovibrio magnetotacticus]GFK92557.1 Na(+)/H(+) antiporter subunit A [Fundidesulfovibrio magnetotacticus]
MTADQVFFVNPAWAFILLAMALPFLSRVPGWRALTLLPPALAVLTAASLTLALNGHALELSRFEWMGTALSLGRVDKLCLVFAWVFAVQSLVGAVYAMDSKTPAEPAAAALHVGGALGCLFAGDFITLFIFWEVTTLGSTLLIWLRRTDAAIAAGYRYFLFHIFGGVLLLFGLILRAKATGSFAFGHLGSGSELAYYDWLILGGFAVNAAVVPLHAWLSDAYPEASAMGAVYLCAFTTKTAVYVLARGFAGLDALAPLGAAMTLYAGLYALVENDVRRSLAYQTIAQVGFMVAGVGVGSAMAINGACAHAVAHVVYKGLMFMAAGAVLTACGTMRMDRLGGLAAKMPFVLVCYLAAAASTSGLPLFSGFTTKSMTITAAFEYSQPLGLALELGALAAILAVGIRLPWLVFFGQGQAPEPVAPVAANRKLAMAAAALLCLGIGAFPGAVYAILPNPVDFHPYSGWSVFQALSLTAFGGLALALTRRFWAPLPGRLADFERLYALVGRAFYRAVSTPLAAVDGVWSEVYRTVGLRGVMAQADAAAIFDRKGIDTVVDGAAYATAGAGRLAASAQTGRLQTYLGASLAIAVLVFALVWFL